MIKKLKKNMPLFDIKITDRPMFKKINRIIINKLNKKIKYSFDICNKGSMKVKTRKVILKDKSVLRFDVKYPSELNRLQRIAVENGIEIPKILIIDGNCKISEWVEGIMIKHFWNLREVFEKSGDLMGRLNTTPDPKNPNHFLTNSEFSSSNAIWTPDRKIYLIDHGRMKTTINPDDSVVQVLLKRIRSKERISVFLKAYSKYRKIDNIMNQIKERNWSWINRTLIENDTPLEGK